MVIHAPFRITIPCRTLHDKMKFFLMDGKFIRKKKKNIRMFVFMFLIWILKCIPEGLETG